MAREDGRKSSQMRPTRITRNYIKHPEGSVLIAVGDTKVVCTASVEESQPRFMREQHLRNRGWVTAEYSMLPRSTSDRMRREVTRGSPGGRTQEIQRLIGRSLRAVVDLKALGERTIWIDCDVIQADGGTRTASTTVPIIEHVAATSVGIIKGTPMLDLCYTEDSSADVDMNVVMTGAGKFVEIQGTAEETPFSKEESDQLLDLAVSGIEQLIRLQKRMIIESRDEVSIGNPESR